MGRKNIPTLGLDIGTYAIKAVELSVTDRRIKLERTLTVPLFDSTPETLAKSLKTVFEPARASLKRLRVSVAGPSVLTRRISLPKMTKEELKGAIRFEAERFIPFPIDDCVLDFQILEAPPEATTMNVLLVAAKGDFIQERMKFLTDLGAHPEVVDLDVFSIANAFAALNGTAPAKTYGLVHIGHQTTLVTLLSGGAPLLVREVQVGGRQVTLALADLQGVPEAAAEVAKKKKTPESREILRAATQKAFESLADQIRNSMTYFENEAGEELKEVWLSGGGSLSAEAAEFFTKELARPAKPWSIGPKLELGAGIGKGEFEAPGAKFEVAIGAALRGWTLT